MLFSSRLSLIIAAASIALSMGLITETINSDIILLAINTCTIAPFLFNRIYPPMREEYRRGIIVVGQDQLAEYFIERMHSDDEPVSVICPDHSRLKSFRELGTEIIDGCDGYDQALEKAGAGHARVLLDLTADSDETIEVCQLGNEKLGFR